LKGIGEPIELKETHQTFFHPQSVVANSEGKKIKMTDK
jgi:hypothetical protein